MPKWIKFELLDATRKTKRWQVQMQEGTALGSVHWYGAWRQYCFFPLADTIYERQCLRDIAQFCETQSRLHRENNKKMA